jgi:hypothetical protein
VYQTAVMQTTDFTDLDETPEPVAAALSAAARNAVHLVTQLRSEAYPS